MAEDVRGVTGGTVSRRNVLGAGAVVGLGAVGMAAAAGCANSGSFDPGMSTAAGLSTVLIPLEKLPVGGLVSVAIDRKPAFISRPTSSNVRAFSAICTHQGCTVMSAGDQLICPCHGSHFELLTGAVLRGPAQKPLPPIDVTIDGGNVIRG
ncbi:MAG: Rieske (2Fe-2S) protein [Nakamurella sp.]